MDGSDDGDRVDRARDGKVPKPHSVLSTRVVVDTSDLDNRCLLCDE